MENFEQSWQRNHHCDVRDFLPADLNSDSQRVAIELLCVDMHYRWQRGERKTAAEYRQEFPHIVRDRDALGELALEEFRIANLSGIRVPADVLAGKYVLDTIGWPTVGNDAGSVATCRWDRDLDQILAAAHTFPQPGESLGDFELIEVLGKGTLPSSTWHNNPAWPTEKLLSRSVWPGVSSRRTWLGCSMPISCRSTHCIGTVVFRSSACLTSAVERLTSCFAIRIAARPKMLVP